MFLLLDGKCLSVHHGLKLHNDFVTSQHAFRPITVHGAIYASEMFKLEALVHIHRLAEPAQTFEI